MTEQITLTPKLQEALPVPVNVVQFDALATDVVLDFNAQLYGEGLKTADGVVSWESLASAQAGLVERSKTDSGVAGLLEAVASPQPDETADVAKGRVLAFLKVSGGTIPQAPRIESTDIAPAEATLHSREPRRARRVGHTVLADGHVVKGSIVSGRNEIQTSYGALRTRGTPRLGNS